MPRIAQNYTQCPEMTKYARNDQICPEMPQNGPELPIKLKVAQNDHIYAQVCPELIQMSRFAQNGQYLSKTPYDGETENRR